MISLNTNGGFSPVLDNINNFKSVLEHEFLHKKDNDNPKFKSDLSTHVDVYIGQMRDSSFDDTTPDFKIKMAGSFANYLMNMDKKDFGQSAIMSKINTFNKINEGLLNIEPPRFQFAPGTLNSLIIQFKGKPYEAEFKKIINE